jgi:hypothetical protein
MPDESSVFLLSTTGSRFRLLALTPPTYDVACGMNVTFREGNINYLVDECQAQLNSFRFHVSPMPV